MLCLMLRYVLSLIVLARSALDDDGLSVVQEGKTPEQVGQQWASEFNPEGAFETAWNAATSQTKVRMPSQREVHADRCSPPASMTGWTCTSSR